MNTAHFDEQQRFILSNYDSVRPFSSFLPGIAGPLGIPLWVFTVNRGQAIASFGVESKDQPIVEFQPANKAYQLTPYLGFRTFLKIDAQLYEPFAPANATTIDRRMVIGMNELELQEINHPIGLQTNVIYFTVPQENFAGLVRQITFKNISAQPITGEVLDGLPAITPYGVNNAQLKEIGRTLEAWMEVFNLDQRVPFYRVRASVADSAEIAAIEAGHFALAFIDRGDHADPLPALVDPAIVFGYNTALNTPDRFVAAPLASLLTEQQITTGKTPCAFFGATIELQPGETITLHSVYGHVSHMAQLPIVHDRMLSASRLREMRCTANTLTQQLTDVIDTHTADPVFDAYCRQTFLDNVLRGGWPIVWEAAHPSTTWRAHAAQRATQPQAGTWRERSGGRASTSLRSAQHAPAAQSKDAVVYHLYSRKHGDLERDYNAFALAAEFYSQGNGAYRDVNQNRRSDVLFEPRVGDFNVRAFMSLMQADGYNPLVIQGSTFTLSDDQRAAVLSFAQAAVVEDAGRFSRPGGDSDSQLAAILSQPFTPGKLLKFIVDHDVQLSISPEDFLDRVMSRAEQHLAAKFGEGYWIDHWTYNLDLIDSYLAVYPDRQHALLFESSLPFFDSSVRVQPRSQKYILAHGQPRQFNAVIDDEEKAALIALREVERNWLRVDHGRGEVYRTTLFNKLVMLGTIKFATLDPYGMGIEMEAGKPGWYDALNGLPGLFGSSLAETFELQRLIEFLTSTLAPKSIELPVEVGTLLHEVVTHLQMFNASSDPQRDFTYWDAVSTAREDYRTAIRLGLSGEAQTVSTREIAEALALFATKLQSSAQRALELNHGVPPTYFTYRVEDYDILGEADAQGRPFIRAKRFTSQVLPLFLEGPVRALKAISALTDQHPSTSGRAHAAQRATQPEAGTWRERKGGRASTALRSAHAMSQPPAGWRAGRDAAVQLYRQIKSSPLFDQELKMYKVNASLAAQPHDIGRARAFVPGWLENESIWLHMEYKYLLEVLRVGLYEEFFSDLKSALVPFLDPQTYGRSPLENSSFIVSSAHPDRSLHGAGFVARLSGSTAEFLSIWQLMMVGPQPFCVNDGELQLKFRPALPGWLFTEQGTITFKFLGQCVVTYHNPRRVDTYNAATQIRRIVLIDRAGESIELAGDIISAASIIGAPWAAQIRSGEVARLDLYLE